MARNRRMRVEPLEDRRMLAASFTGGSYSQNFDTLPRSSASQPWANDSTLEGWYLFHQPAPGIAVTTINADQGSQISFFSLGSSAERALGGHVTSHLTDNPPEGAVAGWMALALDNDAGATINQLRLSYRGEQWDSSYHGGLQSLAMEYGFGASFQLVPSWMPLDSQFNFTKGPAGPRTGPIDGNQPGNYNDISGIIDGLNWTAGSTLWIRWVETNDDYFDHLLAIDNVEIATVSTVVDTLVDENDGDYSAGDLSLREALAIAIPGSTIEFDPSLTSGGPATIVLTQGELIIDKNVVIEGPGADLLTIDASGNDPTPAVDNNDGSGVFKIDDGDFNSYLSTTISGLTITGADHAEGAIRCEESLDLRSLSITGNHGDTVVHVSYGEFAIVDCELSGNSGGAIVSTFRDLDMTNTSVSNNTGQGIKIYSWLGAEVRITDSMISGNTAHKGAGIHITKYYNDAIAIITNTVISGNTATRGSAIYSYGGDLELIDSTISGNLGTGAAIDIVPSDLTAGIFYDGGSLSLDNTNVVNNASHGILTSGQGNLTVVDSDISGNGGVGLALGDGHYYGPEIFIFNSKFNNNTRGLSLSGYGHSTWGFIIASALIQNTEIKDNTTGGGLTLGGGIQAEIVNTEISGNHNIQDGGGISSPLYYAAESLVIRNSTISGNSSDQTGGGISFAGAELLLQESTVSGNSAVGAGGGVGLVFVDAEIVRSTIANNTAGGNGGGVVSSSPYFGPDSSILNITGSIIANNTASSEPDLVPDDDTTVTFSLIENAGSATITGTGNIIGVDPMLGPLQDNGGPTFTHALLPDSSAIDAGDPVFAPPPAYDQRGEGFDRVFNNRIDIGAFESQLLIVTTEFDVLDAFDGLTSLREAIDIANFLAGANEIAFRASLSGTTILLTQGDLDIAGDLIITGLGANLLTIDASGNDPTPELDNNDGSGVFRVAEGFYSVAIAGLTITGADGPSAIFGHLAQLTLNSLNLTGNHGSAAATIGGELRIFDSSITGNTANKGAGIYLKFDPGSPFPYDRPASAGRATITNTLISGNTAAQGSAIYGLASSVTLIDCTVSGNLGAGAAIQMGADDVPHRGRVGGDVTLENTDVVNNEGDGIRTNFAAIADSNVSGNAGTGLRFGALYGGTANISNSSFNSNARGLVLYGPSYSPQFGQKPLAVTIQGSEIKNNTTGGGLTLLGFPQVQITETSISGNHNTASGGGIAVEGEFGFAFPSLMVRNSTISGNSSGQGGGGMSFYGNLTIEESTISGNAAEAAGGGLSVFTTGPAAQIRRSTIVNNSAGTAGGGLYSYAGPYIDNNGAEVTGSIIANNTAATGPDLVGLEGMPVSYSLIENLGSMSIVGTGNIVGVDPMLGPLQDNGGPTWTHALLPGSPAIDAGDPAINLLPQLITPISVSSTYYFTDQYPASHLIDNSGLNATPTIDNYTTVTHASADNTNAWLSNCPGPVGSDYFATGRVPSINFGFSESFEFTGIVIWGYPLAGGPSNNEAKSLSVYFLLDWFYSLPIVLDHQRTAEGQETLSFGQTVETNGISLGITDNYFGAPGASDGDQVGLGEVKFIALADVLYDQRGVGFDRVVGGRIDIGAFEVQAPLPASGDFDGDGDVDGRDFLAWQRGQSTTPLSSGDLADWRTNYGSESVSAVSSLLADSQELTVESEEPEIDAAGLMIAEAEDLGPAIALETVTGDSYVEQVDRALESFAPVRRFGVGGFGEMVARRAVKRFSTGP